MCRTVAFTLAPQISDGRKGALINFNPVFIAILALQTGCYSCCSENDHVNMCNGQIVHMKKSQPVYYGYVYVLYKCDPYGL